MREEGNMETTHNELDRLYSECKRLAGEQEEAAAWEAVLRDDVEALDMRGRKDNADYRYAVKRWFAASQRLRAINREIGNNNRLRSALLQQLHAMPRRVA
jgi:hypothetical protein